MKMKQKISLKIGKYDLGLKPWTICLLLLILADSVYTSYIVKTGKAVEGNPLIFKCMEWFGWSIDTAMIIRIFYCLPFLWILNRWDWSRFTVFCYLAIYMGMVGIQF